MEVESEDGLHEVDFVFFGPFISSIASTLLGACQWEHCRSTAIHYTLPMVMIQRRIRGALRI